MTGEGSSRTENVSQSLNPGCVQACPGGFLGVSEVHNFRKPQDSWRNCCESEMHWQSQKKGTSAHLLQVIGLLSPRILLSFRMRDPAGLEGKRKSLVLDPVWILKCEKQDLQSSGTKCG